MTPTIELLKRHRSIRQFTDDPIAPDLFRQLIVAGQAAASSSFLQGVSIIRVTDRQLRVSLAALANDQAYVETAAEFLVFCADLNRAAQCCARHDKSASTGFTEQFIIATVDAALVAQNVCVAAESAGLGICYIGALRNQPDEVSRLLDLPDNVYPVFGLCLGWPAQIPEVKPRLPVEMVLHENRYRDGLDEAVLADYDAAVKTYYENRSDNRKSMTWSGQMSGLLGREARPHMLGFLRKRGFLQK
jgi:nitroreductase